MPAQREQSTWVRAEGRRPKASEERTRGTAVRSGRLWGIGRVVALASGWAKVRNPPKLTYSVNTKRYILLDPNRRRRDPAGPAAQA